MDNFELTHVKGRLIVNVEVDGIVYEKDVTSYFEESNAHDDWLDYRIALKYGL